MEIDEYLISDLCRHLLPEDPTEIVSGASGNVDKSGEDFARMKELRIEQFDADWYNYGKAAGPKRNREMAQYADALLLIWDGQSRGSASMKKEMLATGKPVFEVILRNYLTNRG